MKRMVLEAHDGLEGTFGAHDSGSDTDTRVMYSPQSERNTKGTKIEGNQEGGVR
jgi:hypothetical protein